MKTPPSPYEQQPKRIELAGVFFVCLACFFTPLSTSLLGLFSLLAALCWLTAGAFRTLISDCRSHPALFFALLLFGFMCLAVTYSPAELPEALDALKKYRELLLLPIIVSLLSISSRGRNAAQNSFLAGCIVLMLISYAMALGLIPQLRYGHSLVFHITHSFFMAVLSFWGLHRAFAEHGFRRVLWLTVCLAATVNLFYVAPGRTGMFVFLFLMLLFCWQRLSLVKAVSGLLLLCMLTTAIYLTSDNFSGRVGEVVNEIKTYEAGQSRTSIGQRFDWWMVAGQLIAEKPLFGHGTGSFQAAQQHSGRQTKIKLTDNPHNEFLFLTVQFGLVGLALFITVCGCQLREGIRLPRGERFLLQGVVGALLAGSLMNSLLFDSQQGHFYLFMSAALMAGRSRDEDS
jgi:O-antigen ligase